MCIQRIRGFGDCALYKSTFYLLNYLFIPSVFEVIMMISLEMVKIRSKSRSRLRTMIEIGLNLQLIRSTDEDILRTGCQNAS